MGNCSTSEAVNPDAVDLTHFDLMKVVGKGGFGKVNAITKKDTGELMALKRMEKFAVLQSAAHLKMVWVERKIMSLQSSPFLCNLLYAFQSSDELFMVMPFMQGGDLRYHLREHGPLPEDSVRFYAAEMLLGLADLHAKRVVYRDLKPENTLLDELGHVRISDFGLGHQLTAERNWQTSGQAGTKGYQDPRVLRNEAYGCEIDVFSFGVCVYELLHGNRPWRSNIPEDNGGGGAVADLDQSRFNELPISSKLSATTASFLNAILAPDWRVRLGCRPRKVNKDGTYSMADQRVQWEEVKAHPFFAGMDWEALYRKEVPPPFTPDNSRANCSPEADLADQLLDHKPRKISDEQQKNFIGWDFRTELGPTKPANAWSDNSAEVIAVAGTGPVAGTTTASTSASGAAAGAAPVVAVGPVGSNGHAASSGSAAAAVAASAPLLVGANGTPPVLHDQTKPTAASPSPSPAPINTQDMHQQQHLQQQQSTTATVVATSAPAVAVAAPGNGVAGHHAPSSSSSSSAPSVPAAATAAPVVLVSPAPVQQSQQLSAAPAVVLVQPAAASHQHLTASNGVLVQDPAAPAGGFTVANGAQQQSRPATSSSISIEDR